MKKIKIKILVAILFLSNTQIYSFAKSIDGDNLIKDSRGSNAPVLSIYEIQDEDGTKIIKVDAYDNDHESGIHKIELPDGTFVFAGSSEYVIHTQYIPATSGTYIFKAYDKNNNVTEKSITIHINDISPSLDVYISKRDAYANTATVQINSWVEAEGGAKISKIELPDGNTVLSSPDNSYSLSSTFIVNKTGNYTFKVFDRQGLCTSKTIFVQLDDYKPNLEVFLSNSVTDPSKKIIHIDAWDNDHESGIHRIEAPNNVVYQIKNNEQYSLNVEYLPPNDGIYTFKAYDRAGHSIEKSINFIHDTELPKIASTVDIAPDKATITIDAWTENGNPLSKIKMPNGEYLYADSGEYSKRISFETTKEGSFDFMVVDTMGYSSKKRVSVSLDEFKIEEATELVEKAELTKDIKDIERARDTVNNLLESASKDSLQDRLNAISVNLNFELKSVTSNVDIYIKSENMLSLSLDTNNVSFENFSGVEDMEKINAVNITINSSLPYKVNAYLTSEIQNADKSQTMDKSILNIKANSEFVYKTFSDTINPITLLDNQIAGNNITHGIDFKLKGNVAHQKDIYKTTVKLEATQK